MNVLRRHALTTGHVKILVWKGLDSSVCVLTEEMERNGDKCQYWTGKEKVLLLIRQPEKMHSVELARVVLLKQ